MSENLSPHIEPSKESPKRDYEYTLAQIEEVLESGNLESFISARLDVLFVGKSSKEISLMLNPLHEGLIHPESEIKRVQFLDGFKVDDRSIYSKLLETLKNLKESLGWESKTIKELVPVAIEKTIIDYFGGIFGDVQKNMQFYSDQTSVDSQVFSVAELKGSNLGVCAEKSAVAQNLLSFVGLEATLIASTRCKLTEEPSEDGHYYNLIKSPNGYFIFDSSNPSITYNEDKTKIINYSPAVYKITEQQYADIKSGGALEVNHNDYISTESSEMSAIPSKRVYGGPTIINRF